MLAIARAFGPCPRCGYQDVRPSRRPRGFFMRLLGLRRHRCMACRAVILAPNTGRGSGKRYPSL